MHLFEICLQNHFIYISNNLEVIITYYIVLYHKIYKLVILLFELKDGWPVEASKERYSILF
jgi:hypothetical protein